MPRHRARRRHSIRDQFIHQADIGRHELGNDALRHAHGRGERTDVQPIFAQFHHDGIAGVDTELAAEWGWDDQFAAVDDLHCLRCHDSAPPMGR
jgi:hypothetical protein